jgi:hypothetical protein
MRDLLAGYALWPRHRDADLLFLQAEALRVGPIEEALARDDRDDFVKLATEYFDVKVEAIRLILADYRDDPDLDNPDLVARYKQLLATFVIQAESLRSAAST